MDGAKIQITVQDAALDILDGAGLEDENPAPTAGGGGAPPVPVTFEDMVKGVGEGSKMIQLRIIFASIWAQEPDAKIVVFSNEGTTMHKVKAMLKENQILSEVIDGSTAMKKRAQIIENFQTPDSQLKVCLLTAKCGNAGLTLTAAHHLLLMEPSLNVAMEKQAMGRIHRFGQKKPVTIHRLVALGTVEERTLVVTGGNEAGGTQNAGGAQKENLLQVLGIDPAQQGGDAANEEED